MNEQLLAAQEKTRVALISLLAALALTAGKLIVGLVTNSLGILAEALHSGLDLVAAAITLWAVKVADKPADSNHTYGHGKVENLSALVETGLLLLTCVWIIYEATNRLFGAGSAHVDANFWAFLVMGVSIAVDIGRSRSLRRVAQRYDSQALEADALHFSTDIWSSAVVLLGLICVLVGEQVGMSALYKADALAALAVAGIVIWVSLKLGRRAIDQLLDAVPRDLQDKVTQAIASVPGVEAVKQVRLRKSGAGVFADVVFTVKRTEAFERTHRIADDVENAVRSVAPGADVVAHVEPAP